jgi:Signal peptidase, peptidase S26
MSGGSFSEAPTIPACSGRILAEGFTYHVAIRIGGNLWSSTRAATSAARSHPTRARAISISPSARDRHPRRQGRRSRWARLRQRAADDILTDAFPATHLGPNQYFVLGDNRGASQDSRDFGPVPRAAIFGRVFLIYWPLGRFGVPGYDRNLKPPGAIVC